MNDASALFLGCDWGTTSFRLRLAVRQTLEILAETRGPDGVKTFTQGKNAAGKSFAGFFEEQVQALLAQVGISQRPAAIISGMASSTLGWRELPYASAPFPLDGERARGEEIAPGVRLLSGVRTAGDVMRGEETELVGLYSLSQDNPLWRDACLLLPGTHCKQARVRAGVLVDFVTALTGELHELLSTQSVLRHSVAAAEEGGGQDFVDGVLHAQRQGLSRALFRVRSRHLLDGRPPDANRAFLSGVLIGGELSDLLAREPSAALAVGVAGPLGALYRRALEALGAGGRFVPLPESVLSRATLAGQAALLTPSSAGTPAGSSWPR